MKLPVMVAAPQGVRLSAGAIARLRELRAESGQPGLLLRVLVEGGGCSGFRYGFEIAEAAGPDDQRFEADGVAVVVDAMSAEFLGGAEIDWVDDLTGAQFVVRNPNATRTCGCGSSFSV